MLSDAMSYVVRKQLERRQEKLLDGEDIDDDEEIDKVGIFDI